MSWDFHMHKIGLEVYVHRIILSSTIETYMSGSYLYVVSSAGGGGVPIIYEKGFFIYRFGPSSK